MTTPQQNKRQKPRAVLYLRQSTFREESISLELQETAGRDYAAKSGYEVVGVESDPGISGRTWNRPAVQRVMSMVADGTVDVIVLWKWSRLSRSRLDWAVAADKVETAGGRIESATEPLDVSTSTGRLARGMLTEFAAFESERIGDVWKEAHERRVRSGRPANGKPRFGYQYTKEDGFIPDPVTGPVLAEMYARYNAGQSVYSLVAWANEGPTRPATGYGVSADGLWSARTIRRMLDTGFGAGYFTRHGERVKGVHEPVISEEMFQEYLARRETRRTRRRGEKSPYLLSGLIRCECGSTMHAGLFGSARKPKYRCKAAAEKRSHSGGYVTAPVVEVAVLGWLQEVQAEITTAAGTVKRPTRTASAGPSEAVLARRMIKLENRLDNLTTRYMDDEVSREVYERLKASTDAEFKEAETALRAVRVTVSRPAEQLVPDLLRDWDVLPVEVRRDMLSRLIHPVLVRPGRPVAEVLVAGLWEEPPAFGERG
ncbi:recombinase family protein [Zhihengliuella halotolerans]|uniref:DNA invertase Pin-like site-specific DNA recombinase n=1 Tax=Zhihengliuella halotolerans TaxID=370736 RepID=A0A4Q8ADR4_9MICC|nr:recombinase family protein [Zhihengliuella halotolerans]RZU61773.1 DNA invertase Pin-like site-specific DNA recombinase [Zhihengliuella halotolerans]